MKYLEEGYYTGANDALYALQHDIPAHPQTVARLCELRAQDANKKRWQPISKALTGCTSHQHRKRIKHETS